MRQRGDLRVLKFVTCTTLALNFSQLMACSVQSEHVSRPSGGEVTRDPHLAQDLCDRATALMVEDPQRAQELLLKAIDADLYHGPSHNNLGVLYLHQGMLYEAASEFEWARRLMPGHPDPKVNLAITLERAGKVDAAISSYAAALEAYPDYLPAIMGMAKAQIRDGRTDSSTVALLTSIAERTNSEAWRQWALGQLTTHRARRVAE